MTEKGLTERDSKRDIGLELLESVRQMKAGQKGAVHHIKPLTDSEGEVRELTAADVAAFQHIGDVLPELVQKKSIK